MSRVKISQHVALMIEVLRANGVSDDALIENIRQGDVQPFAAIGDGHFDFAELHRFAKENGDDFVRAVREGYEMKSNTINGIKYYLKVKLSKKPGVDYADRGDHLDQLRLKPDEFRLLKSSLSPFWFVTELERTGDRDIYAKIELPTARS